MTAPDTAAIRAIYDADAAMKRVCLTGIITEIDRDNFPGIHFCPEWDYMAIWAGSPEWDGCLCACCVEIGSGQQSIATILSLCDEVDRLRADLAEMTRRRGAWAKRAEGYEALRLALREKVGAPWPPHMSRLLWAGIAADEKKRADDAEAENDRLRSALSGLLLAVDEWAETPPGSDAEIAATGPISEAAETARAAPAQKEATDG